MSEEIKVTVKLPAELELTQQEIEDFQAEFRADLIENLTTRNLGNVPLVDDITVIE